MSENAARTTDSIPHVPLIKAVDLNPKLERGSLEDQFEVSFVPMAAVEAGSGRINATVTRNYTDVKKGYTFFREGDVLFAKITPCMENGKMAVARHLRNGIGFGSTEFHVLRPKEGVDPNYIYHFVASSRFRSEAAHHMTGAVGQKRVPASFLKRIEIPLPSLEKQQHIVSEIEKQFSRLDEAVAGLKRIKANLKRYKAAVLKAAVEGKLTEEWRKAHHNVESGAELLKRILAERKKKWEEKNPAKKYKEPAAPDASNLPELPEGWVWATVEQLSYNVQYGSSAKTNEDPDGVPVLRMGNIFEGQLKLYDLKYLPRKHFEFPKLLLKEGDLLFNRTNSPELVGKTAVYAGEPTPCSFASYLIRVQFADGASPLFISYLLNSVYGQRWIKAVVSQQVGQANVNGTKLQAFGVPLPSYVEQEKIIEEVERCLSVTGYIGATAEVNLSRAERLRQGILRRAFSGKIGPVSHNCRPKDVSSNARIKVGH